MGITSIPVGVDVVISGSHAEVFGMCAGSPDNGSDYGVPYSWWPWIKGLLSVCESESRSMKTPLVLGRWKAGGGDRRGGGARARPGRTGPWGVCVCRDFRPVWGLHAIETSQTSTTGERSGQRSSLVNRTQTAARERSKLSNDTLIFTFQKVMQGFFSLSLMRPFTQDGLLHWQELYEF